MKRKHENIANLLLVGNLVIVIIAIFLLQNTLSIAEASLNLTSVKDNITKNAFIVILLISIQFILSAILYYTFKNKLSKNINAIDQNGFFNTNEDFDIKPSILAQEKQAAAITAEDFAYIETKLELEFKNINSLEEYCNKLFTTIAERFEIAQGIFYTIDLNTENEKVLNFAGGYAYFHREDNSLKIGEGLAGQVAKAQRIINIKNIPDGYIKIVSGLGESTPTNLLICPIISENTSIAILELASFKEFSKVEETHFATLSNKIKDQLIDININS